MNLNDTFRVAVRLRLRELGWRQQDLAEALGCTQATVSQALNSEKGASLRTVEKYAIALGVDAFDLLPKESKKISLVSGGVQ